MLQEATVRSRHPHAGQESDTVMGGLLVSPSPGQEVRPKSATKRLVTDWRSRPELFWTNLVERQKPHGRQQATGLINNPRSHRPWERGHECGRLDFATLTPTRAGQSGLEKPSKGQRRRGRRAAWAGHPGVPGRALSRGRGSEASGPSSMAERPSIGRTPARALHASPPLPASASATRAGNCAASVTGRAGPGREAFIPLRWHSRQWPFYPQVVPQLLLSWPKSWNSYGVASRSHGGHAISPGGGLLGSRDQSQITQWVTAWPGTRNLHSPLCVPQMQKEGKTSQSVSASTGSPQTDDGWTQSWALSPQQGLGACAPPPPETLCSRVLPRLPFLALPSNVIPAGRLHCLTFSFVFLRVICNFLVSSLFCLYLMQITSPNLFNSIYDIFWHTLGP